MRSVLARSSTAVRAARAVRAVRPASFAAFRPLVPPPAPRFQRSFFNQMPAFPIDADTEAFQEQSGGKKVTIEVQAGPGTLSVWTGHVHLAIGGGARDVTLVFRPSTFDADAPLWADAPQDATHIKQWHADIVESLLGLVLSYIHGVKFTIVGLEGLGEGGFLVGWVQETVDKWAEAEAAETGKQIKVAENLTFVSTDVFEGRAEKSEDGHKHSHACGPTCSH